jgi:hypothetical protein
MDRTVCSLGLRGSHRCESFRSIRPTFDLVRTKTGFTLQQFIVGEGTFDGVDSRRSTPGTSSGFLFSYRSCHEILLHSSITRIVPSRSAWAADEYDISGRRWSDKSDVLTISQIYS